MGAFTQPGAIWVLSPIPTYDPGYSVRDGEYKLRTSRYTGYRSQDIYHGNGTQNSGSFAETVGGRTDVKGS